MNMGLRRRVAVVTGASQVLGEAIARALRAEGSGASRDFGLTRTPWRIKDLQVAIQRYLISSHFPPADEWP
jgi:NAD(P)-dependent dehydrogenase (short-subunit alcohol dehydrogenase family)